MLLARYLPEPNGRRLVVATYSAVFVMIALAYNAVWWYAAGGGRLLDPHADRVAVREISRRFRVGPASYLLAFVLAYVNVWASLAVHGLLAAYYVLPVREPAIRAPRRMS